MQAEYAIFKSDIGPHNKIYLLSCHTWHIFLVVGGAVESHTTTGWNAELYPDLLSMVERGLVFYEATEYGHIDARVVSTLEERYVGLDLGRALSTRSGRE